MLASTITTPYETWMFSILVLSGLAWIAACFYGFKRPKNRIKAIALQLLINTEIGILTSFVHVRGMGVSAETGFAIGHYPDSPSMLPHEKIAVFDPSQFLWDVRFHYRISEVGMWIYGVTFILTLLVIMLFWPNQNNSPNKAEMATPRKPSDQF